MSECHDVAIYWICSLYRGLERVRLSMIKGKS